MDQKHDGKKRLDSGGFAYGEIPRGWERIRPPHEDEPLSPNGRTIYYFTAVLLVFVTLFVVLTAVIENS